MLGLKVSTPYALVALFQKEEQIVPGYSRDPQVALMWECMSKCYTGCLHMEKVFTSIYV